MNAPVEIKKPRKQFKTGAQSCRNVKFVTGSDKTALFWDADGKPVSCAQVIREVDEGYRHFWKDRIKFQPKHP